MFLLRCVHERQFFKSGKNWLFLIINIIRCYNKYIVQPNLSNDNCNAHQPKQFMNCLPVCVCVRVCFCQFHNDNFVFNPSIMSNILDHHTNDYNNRTTIVIKSKSDESLKNLSIAIDNNDQEDFDGNDHDNRNQFIINESSSSSLNNNDEDNLKLFDQQQVLSSPNTTTDLYNNNSRNKPYLSTSYSFPGVRDYLLFGDCTNNTTTTANSFKDRSTTTTPLTNLSDSFAQLYLPNFAQHISTTIMSGLNWINQINAATLFQNFWTSSGFFRRRFSSSSSSTVSSSSSNTNNHHSIAQQSNNQNVDDLTYRQYKFAKILNGTIRLHTLKPSELIELSSFGLVELDTDVEPGIGHEFQVFLMT